MVLYQHGISSPEPLKWLLSNLRNSSSCLCVRQYCSSSHMSPNYPRMVFAFFSFLWSSTCCGFSANTICMPDHEVIFFFSKPLLGCSCVLPHHRHCTWVSCEGTTMPFPECTFRASAFSIRSLAGVREPLFLLSFGLPVLKRSFIFWVYPLLLQSSQAVQRNIWQRMPFLSLPCFLLLSPPLGSCWISAVNSKAKCCRCGGGVTYCPTLSEFCRPGSTEAWT